MTETMNEARPTLLLVDDVTTNLDILLEALGEDYIVRVATDGASALASVKKAMPDLILLDIMMPDMDGLEVCRRLKDDFTTRDIPVIFLTALNEDADEARGLALGAGDYITKPFNPAIVKARVRNHLELKKHRDHLEALVAERTRELAKANERLKELGKIKDNYLEMIAHELRTPANGVLGIGELILDICPKSQDSTHYSELFKQSSLRLCNLIDDATMIADIEKMPLKNTEAISFSVLIDEVRESLKDINISLVRQGNMEPVFLQGDRTLLKRALATMILLATSFSRDKNKAQITGVVDALAIRVHFDLDYLSLSEEQAASFFEIASSVRSSSTAETLGLSPVVAHKIIAGFGGEMKLVKGEGKAGCLEAILIREQGDVKNSLT